MLKHFNFALGLIVLSCSLFTSAQASSVSWTLDGTFMDGGILAGSFDYDADTNTYSNIAITTTNYIREQNPGFPFGGSYTELFDFYSPEDSKLIVSTSANIGGDPLILLLDFDGALTNAGGLLNLVTGAYNSIEITSNEQIRDLMPGATVSAVPIPAAAWLFGSALAGLGWMRRKQTV